ncbi:MAG: hypothetical protein CMM10_19410 [Rhodospirillaceae bacterium]|nr:hypothetical protein [Rhodospirillaceae bacterium]
MTENTDQSQPEEKNAEVYNFGQLHVLLVEANEFLREVLGSMLRELNFGHVEICRTPDQAFNYFRSHAVDLIVSDWAPGAEELRFLKMARTSPDSPNRMIPIIVVSAFSELRHVEMARDLGMTEFLALPLSAKILYDHICAVIEHPRLFVETPTYFGPDRRRHQVSFDGEERRTHAPAETPGDQWKV